MTLFHSDTALQPQAPGVLPPRLPPCDGLWAKHGNRLLSRPASLVLGCDAASAASAAAVCTQGFVSRPNRGSPLGNERPRPSEGRQTASLIKPCRRALRAAINEELAATQVLARTRRVPTRTQRSTACSRSGTARAGGRPCGRCASSPATPMARRRTRRARRSRVMTMLSFLRRWPLNRPCFEPWQMPIVAPANVAECSIPACTAGHSPLPYSARGSEVDRAVGMFETRAKKTVRPRVNSAARQASVAGVPTPWLDLTGLPPADRLPALTQLARFLPSSPSHESRCGRAHRSRLLQRS